MTNREIRSRYQISIGPTGGAILGAALIAAFTAGGALAWLTSGAPANVATTTPAPAPARAETAPPTVASAASVEGSPIIEEARDASAAAPLPHADLPLNREEVREVQKRLRGLGYNPGPIDGNAGRVTLAAALRYQQDRNLSQSGRIDRALFEALQQDQSPAVAAPPLVKVAQRGRRSSDRTGHFEAPRPWQ
jgi:hypothetical protein